MLKIFKMHLTNKKMIWAIINKESKTSSKKTEQQTLLTSEELNTKFIGIDN